MLTIIVISIIGGLFAIGAAVFWVGVGEDKENVGPAVMFTLVVLVVVLIPIIGQHTHVLAIPPRIAALERTVEQQTALISTEATLGQGLEGLEIKQEIQKNISKLNNLIARAEYIEISPWWMFKPNMDDG